MLLLKYSTTILFLLVSSSAFSMFSEKECLDAGFTVDVAHKDKITFGMAKTKLKVMKDKCEIIVSHQKLKFLKNQWKIDVCREPVHIKAGLTGVEVLKKNGNCPNKSAPDFCEALVKIREIIQDDGLIFANGEKENLTTDHGRIYCAYQLLGGYLDGNRIYSRYAKSTKSMTAPTPVHPLTPVESTPSVDPVQPASDKQTEDGTF